MINFINCENEFLFLSMEISGKRVYIFLMCLKLFLVIFINFFYEFGYERFLVILVFGFC